MSNTATKYLNARPRKTPKANVFLSIPDDELIRSAHLAYEDGYADARDYGQDGFFQVEGWCAEARERYLQGFAAGIRVYKLTWG